MMEELDKLLRQRQPKSLVSAYDNNPLIEACGPMLDAVGLAKRLVCLPSLPGNLKGIPPNVRWHQLMSIKDLHIPTQAGIDLAMTIDLIMRQGYAKRQPRDPKTWSYLYGTRDPSEMVAAPMLTASVVGISGTGKSIACERALKLYPQVAEHPNFPHLVSSFKQLLWLKVNVPASGRLIDLAEVLMRETDEVLQEDHFQGYLGKSHRRGHSMWNDWCHKARSNFLGVLVLDEIQNLFRVVSLTARRKAANSGAAPPELRVVDDEALKNILTFINTSRIGLVVLGTADGMAAFSKRFSVGQRLVSAGYHHFKQVESADDLFYREYLFPSLWKYMWADELVVDMAEIRHLIHELSGGVQRILIELWIHAHRCMWDRGDQQLETKDFRVAMDTWLAPLKPPIEALRTQDPRKLSVYEDLLPRDDLFWMQLTGVSAGEVA